MLDKHYPRDGGKLLIGQMSDEHLRAMVRLILKGMKENRTAASDTSDINEYQRRLYDLPEIDLAQAARENRQAVQKLYPYLAEMFLREGFDDVRLELIEELGRDSAIPTTYYNRRETEVPRLLEAHEYGDFDAGGDDVPF